MAATAIKVQRIQLGSQGLEISKQGLGCLGMSAYYGPPKPQPDIIKLIHHAVDSGVTFFDTSDLYGPHTNEILLVKALKGGLREKVQIATKFGKARIGGNMKVRGDPEYVRACCEASLKRLEVDYIDLYYIHRIDTTVPIVCPAILVLVFCLSYLSLMIMNSLLKRIGHVSLEPKAISCWLCCSKMVGVLDSQDILVE